MSAPGRRRAGGWVRLAASVALLALGGQLCTLSSWRMLLVGLGIVGLGVVGLGWTLLRSDDAARRTWRSKLAISLVASAAGLLGMLYPALLIPVSSHLPRDDTGHFDRELGWFAGGPHAVGVRLDVVDPAREQVIVLGDSILYGKTLRREETAAYTLDHTLRPYQVVNASVSGYSIDQYAIHLRKVLPITRPKLVVVGIFSGNDFEITSRMYGWGAAKPFFHERGGRLVRVNPDLSVDNCIDRVAHSLLFHPFWNDHDLAQNLLDRLCQVEQLPLGEAERVISLLFRDIEQSAARAGARVLFVLLPEQRLFLSTQHDDRVDPSDILHATFYRALRRLLLAGGHDTFEPAADLAAADGPVEDLFIDQGHYNARGQAVLARTLEREIRQRGLLPGLR